MANNHTYTVKTCNGLKLHVIKTAVTNIKLLTLNEKQNLAESSYYGINGGYFDMGHNNMLSFAMSDGEILCWSNNDIGFGMLSWDTIASRLEFGTTGAELTAYLGNYGAWGQGGHRLILGYNNWRKDMIAVNELTAKAIDEKKNGRTALVVDIIDNQAYLIVARDANDSNTIDVTKFRTALNEYFSLTEGSTESPRYKGIMLDGSYSSQLKAKDGNTTVNIKGARRPLCQIVALRDAT